MVRAGGASNHRRCGVTSRFQVDAAPCRGVHPDRALLNVDCAGILVLREETTLFGAGGSGYSRFIGDGSDTSILSCTRPSARPSTAVVMSSWRALGALYPHRRRPGTGCCSNAPHSPRPTGRWSRSSAADFRLRSTMSCSTAPSGPTPTRDRVRCALNLPPIRAFPRNGQAGGNAFRASTGHRRPRPEEPLGVILAAPKC